MAPERQSQCLPLRFAWIGLFVVCRDLLCIVHPRALLQYDKDYEALIEASIYRRQQQQQQQQDDLQQPETEFLSDTRQNPKVAFYMTTHLSDEHVAFLTQCWPSATRRMPLLQRSDLILYASVDPDSEWLEALEFQSITVQRYSAAPVPAAASQSTLALRKAAKQSGAKQAMVDPFRFGWFDDYDWIVRLNPDVLLRDDIWLERIFSDDTLDGIFMDISWKPLPPPPSLRFHTDFYAVRPRALQASEFIRQANQTTTAEHHLGVSTRQLRASGRWTSIPNATRQGKRARLVGRHSPVIHHHGMVQYCPDYFDATDGTWF